jgi:phage-related protein
MPARFPIWASGRLVIAHRPGGYSRVVSGQAGKVGGRGRGSVKPAAARAPRQVRHRWRDYETASGRRPIKDFLAGLDDEDLASIVAAMKEVRQQGLQAARHLDGEIYEVRADGKGVIYRVLFAPQGNHKQVFLSLEALKKKTQKTPPQTIRLAKRRLLDWQRRGK